MGLISMREEDFHQDSIKTAARMGLISMREEDFFQDSIKTAARAGLIRMTGKTSLKILSRQQQEWV